MTNAAEKAEAPLTGLDLLRAPFKPHHISKLPKPTKAQTEAVKADYCKGVRCTLCGSRHHPDVVHLDYVGHAALTDRLLDCDPQWSWEPVAFREGLPAFDASGGLWIKLTVCGVSRLGYGHAATKPGVDPGAREKEVIGDAMRNAAMRFGAALDLWHKGDLHVADNDTEAVAEGPKEDVGSAATDFAIATMRTSRDLADLTDFWTKNAKGLRADLSAADFARVEKAKDEEKVRLTPASDAFPGDIPLDEAA